MSRVFNFSAGPSMLPESVLNKAADELLDYEGTGESVMEMSHRSKEYQAIIDQAEADLRTLMNIPDNYKVLFLQGGASTQFAAIPLNFMNGSGKADYIVSGVWSKKAAAEASRYGDVKIVASSADQNFSCVPEVDPSEFRSDADYFYICMNETVHGNIIRDLPETGDVPLIADISSCFLSEPLDVSKFGMLYGGAQKNIAPAGVTIVIVRKDLVDNGKALDCCPTMLKYSVQAKNDSLYNTPPCYGIYMSMLMFRWLKKMGGVSEIQKINEYKAGLLYDFIDNSSFYTNPVRPEDRSIMNVPFVTGSEEMDAKFVKEATANGLVSLKGHRLVGGMRASIYNAMPVEGVEKLCDFIRAFDKNNR